MNKTQFVKKLQRELDYAQEKCMIINDIIDNTFLLGKKGKDKMISDLIIKLKINSLEANNIYEISKNIISQEIKNKVKHPFKSQD